MMLEEMSFSAVVYWTKAEEMMLEEMSFSAVVYWTKALCT